MPLTDTHTKTVGFLLADSVATGSFFVVQKDEKCFIVTCAHNLIEHNSITAAIRTHAGDVLYEWDPGDWFFPDLDGRLDLAINCFDPVADEELLFSAVPIDEQSIDSLEAPVMLGTTAYFAGLLSPVKAMAKRGVPMVRSATVGALYQPGVTYEDGEWGPMQAHLLDTRSWGGFSGSPCWSQLVYPGPQMYERPAVVDRDKPDHIELGELHHYTTFLGMFVGHARESGAGVVIPAETIREALGRKELHAMCKESTCKQADRRDLTLDDEIRADTTRYQQEDFLADLRAVTRRTDTEQPDAKAKRKGA